MLSAYETGKQRPSFATIDKILSALNFSAGDLALTLYEISEKESSGEASSRLGRSPFGVDPSAELEKHLYEVLGENHGLGELSSREKQFLFRLLPTLALLMRLLKN